jgi:hypothetical protein
MSESPTQHRPSRLAKSANLHPGRRFDLSNRQSRRTSEQKAADTKQAKESKLRLDKEVQRQHAAVLQSVASIEDDQANDDRNYGQ